MVRAVRLAERRQRRLDRRERGGRRVLLVHPHFGVGLVLEVFVAGHVARQLRAGLLFLERLDHSLLDQFAAGPAGRSAILRDHGDGFKLCFAFRHRFEHGGALGADRVAVRRILNIAAGIDGAGLAEQRRADFVVRVGRVGFFASRVRQVDQFSGFHVGS